MFVRLTLADVNEGEMDNALEYVKNTVIPSYDGISGLLGIAACATNDGRFMAWSTWANEEAKEASISGKLVVEEYMDGPELSLDALIFNGHIQVTGIGDRIIQRAPYFVEVGHTLPSNQPQEKLNLATELFCSAIKALGIDIGAAKGDIKLTKDGPKVIEIAARLSGGWMSTYTYPLATGVNLMKAAIEIALGETPTDLKKKYDHVLVCDDGSSDNTASIASEMGATVIKHSQNLGYGSTIKTIFNNPQTANI